MKKFLLLLMAAMLLPLASRALTLEPNQRIMGHYTTDEWTDNGWGKTYLTGLNTVATDITADEIAVFQGSKIVAFRMALAQSAPVSRVFVMPLDTNGQPTGEVTEWECNVSAQGWNMVQLATPYLINLPEGCGLRIGFDYTQQGKNDKVISAVNVGTIYPTWSYRNGKWLNYGINTNGNLSLQCITENDNYPEYIVRIANLTCRSMVKTGDDLGFSFQARNLGAGEILPGDATFDVAIDGNYVKTISNTAAMQFNFDYVMDNVNTAGLEAGVHTLSVTMNALKGEPVENPVTLTATFKNFDYGYTHQKHLVEQFTSTTCTYCPQGTANVLALTQMRDDIAWVSVHGIQSTANPDPFTTSQCDTIFIDVNMDGFPEGTFDRTVGIESANSVCAVLTALSPSTMSTFLDYVAETPAWATVNINSTYDPATRKAVITIDGEMVPNFEDMMGSNSKLSVYITEDGLVYPQTSGGSDYVHNNVFRQALGSVRGVAINKTGDNYKNEFTFTVPEAWDADQLSVTAFISRPLRSNAYNDIYVNNANKRKLGEFDEPTVIPGDVDGNGKVNIDDVTSLINVLLKGTPASDGADVDGNGSVNIDDVTTLINKLLSGN